jgi:hypothetical protein
VVSGQLSATMVRKTSNRRIQAHMKRTGRLAVALLFGVAAVMAGMTGTFRGTIVDPGTKSSADRGWIYVQGRNQMLRRVQIADAKVIYAPEVPAALKATNPATALTDGAEVRVTAAQDGSGEWRATTVEILKPAPQSRRFARTKM